MVTNSKEKSHVFSLSNISIQKRLPLLICFLLLIVIIIFSWTTYYSVREASLDAGNQRVRALTEQFGSLFKQSTDYFLTSTGSAANSDAVKNFIKFGGDANREKVLEAISKISHTADTLCMLIEILDRNRKQIFATTDVQITATPDSEFIYSPLVPGNTVATEFYRRGENVYWAAVSAVMDKDKPIGYLIKWRLVLATPQVTTQLSRLLGAQASLYLGNADGKLWYNLVNIVPGPPVQIIGLNGNVEYTYPEGKTVIASAQMINGTKWAVLIELSKERILQTAYRFLQYLIVIGIVLLIIGFFAAWFMSRSITKPLNRLKDAASGIAGGDYSSFVDIKQQDELGKLASAFNSMLVRVRDAQNHLEHEVSERTLQLKNANNELLDLNQKLKDIDETKTNFFTNVSHDLRTPLSLILGPAELLISEHNLPEESRKKLEVIRSNARNLLKQVNNLLDLSKLDAGKMRLNYSNINLGKLVSRTAAYFESMAKERNISFETDFPQSFFVQADYEKMERILLNLFTNAFKFTPQDGKISCLLDAEAGMAVFKIIDSGPGFDPELKTSLFQRFYQGKEGSKWHSGGSGLGLSIVKEFVELHNGRINVEDSPAGGAIFSFSIPLSAPEGTLINNDIGEEEIDHIFNKNNVIKNIEAELPGKETVGIDLINKTGQVHNNKNSTILIIEDNPEMNRFIAETLNNDYKTYSVFNGKDGLETALKVKPDIIITDVMMPEMPGDAMINELKKHPELNNIPVIVLTAKADENFKIDLLNKGITDYLNKPFLIEELKARVNNIASIKRVKDYLRTELNTQNNNINVLVQELSERKNLLESSLKEKEILLKEIHHRVKNNLQIISSLLNLQISSLKDPVTVEIIKNSQNRIKSMALVHEKLYRSDNFMNISFKDYVNGIVSNLNDSYHLTQNRIDFKIRIEELLVSIDVAIYLGLIITELVSNSLKHAFIKSGGKRNEISITGSVIEGSSYSLIVKDNGKGLPPEYSTSDAETLGLQLVHTLTDQIDGTVKINNSGGAEFRIIFPLKKDIQVGESSFILSEG